ncbi:hypothetical protein VP01_4339g1, partial [Puccinia sorghi]
SRGWRTFNTDTLNIPPVQPKFMIDHYKSFIRKDFRTPAKGLGPRVKPRCRTSEVVSEANPINEIISSVQPRFYFLAKDIPHRVAQTNEIAFIGWVEPDEIIFISTCSTDEIQFIGFLLTQ